MSPSQALLFQKISFFVIDITEILFRLPYK